MNKVNSVLQQVMDTICEYGMIDKGDRILAAVSGGADSVCMLHVLNTLKKTMGFDIYCAHLNHCLRGDAADNDEKFVIELCESLDIPVFTKLVDVAALAAEKKLTTEEAGRLARYDFFKELSQKYKICKTATAHNSDDNAETVLMRIIRGTGTDGLKGISYIREDGVIRPLLDISRADIEAYCRGNNLSFCTDSTNSDNDYTRNKIRNELLPFIEQNFNPNIKESLCRLARNASEDADFLNSYAERLYARLCNPLPGEKPVTLHIESLRMVDKSIAARVLKIAADGAKPGIRLEKKHIYGLFELMTKQTGASINLPDGLDASVQYGWLSFADKNSAVDVVEEADGFFTEIAPLQTVLVEALGKHISLRIENAKEYKCKVNETAISYDLVDGQMLFLRNRRSGDRIVWFPDGKTKKIKNILIDAKIPKQDRDRIPLLCTGTEVLAIVGSRVSEKYKVTNETERALVIEYGNIEQTQGVN